MKSLVLNALLISSLCNLTDGFRSSFGSTKRLPSCCHQSTETEDVAAPLPDYSSTPSRGVDPKEAVKLFGRLAEKYIMLDSSGGMCCYSGCSDCEFRLPGGGYRMADQSSSRPKWIPVYESRSANGKEHTSKWNALLFGPDQTSLTKSEFVDQVQQLDFAPPLGGPYVADSAAALQDVSVAERLFDALADGKERLAKIRMSKRLRELAGGEDGLTWNHFQSIMGLS